MLDFISYSHAKSETQAILRLRISTEDPIEIDAFVGAFTSLAEEYRRDIKENYPDASDDARIFVKEIRKNALKLT